MTPPAFTLPPELEATRPPETRGIARDEVRLMVVSRGSGEIAHALFRDLPEFLEPGDLLVVNNSATLPAALPAQLEDGTPVELRFSTPVPGMPEREWRTVELRSPGGTAPFGSLGGAGNVELPTVMVRKSTVGASAASSSPAAPRRRRRALRRQHPPLDRPDRG